MGELGYACAKPNGPTEWSTASTYQACGCVEWLGQAHTNMVTGPGPLVQDMWSMRLRPDHAGQPLRAIGDGRKVSDVFLKAIGPFLRRWDQESVKQCAR